MARLQLRTWLAFGLVLLARFVPAPIRRAMHTLEGQGLVEYAMVLVFVALVVMIIVVLLGPWTGNVFSNIVSHL